MITKIKYDQEKLKSLNNEELVGILYDKACELHFGTFGESFNEVNPVFRELFATWVLEAEVQNGGFDQFFRNNGLEWGKYAVNGLERISAYDYAEVTKKAINVYKNQSDEFITKRNPEFDKLDDEFFDLEGLGQFQVKYIRDNLEAFIEK